MRALSRIESRTVVFDADNVDTDQIIPARFLVATERGSWGDKLFADRRYDPDGALRPEFPLNAEGTRGARALVAGRNFGCGSSREHAAWALADFGFQAVLAPSFADIFRANALKNGLVPVVVPAEVHSLLVAEPGRTVAIDVDERTMYLWDGTRVPFLLDDFSRYCLLEGIDELGFLDQHRSDIDEYEKNNLQPEEVVIS